MATSAIARIVPRDPVLIKLESARQFLAEATSLAEVKNIADVAASAEVYARRQQLGDEAIGFAHRVKTDALARLGELLRVMPKAKGTAGLGRPKLGGTRTEPPNDSPTLADLGISKKVAAVAQQLAALPADVREEIAAGEKTVTQAQRDIKEQTREQRRDENRAKVAAVPSATVTVGAARFATIVIDPPWDFAEEGDDDVFGRTRPAYAQMTEGDLANLPVGQLSDDDCHLYLWITNRSLMTGKGWRLAEAWGFRPVTLVTWCKPSIGVGNYFRNNTEHLIFAVKGSQPLTRHDIGTWFTAPRGAVHSAKPVEAYSLIESVSPGPYLEMFARGEREGWSQWGEGDGA